MRILSQNASTNGVERASPGQVDVTSATRCCGNGFDPARHFYGGPPCKRQQQNALRIDPIDDQVGNAMGESLGFTCPGSSNHKQRRTIKCRSAFYTMLDCAPLVLIQTLQIIERHNHSLGNELQIELALIDFCWCWGSNKRSSRPRLGG